MLKVGTGASGGGSPPPPPPLQPTVGMGLWLKASSGLYVNPNTWSDQSGNGNDVIAPGGAANPTAGAGINGHTTVEFNSANAQKFESAIGDDISNIVSPTHYSIFAVFKYTGVAPILGTLFSPTIINDSTQQVGMYAGVAAGIETIWGFNNAAVNQGLKVPAGAPAAHYVSYVQNGVVGGSNGLSVAIDAGAPVTEDGATVILAPGQRIMVGNPNFGAGFWDGSIGEILVYPFALTAPEQVATKAYLAAAWGL